MASKVFPGKVFFVVTGASQGIGKQITETIGSQLENGSLVLLLARNTENLKKTASALPSHIHVETRGVDLSLATEKDLRGNKIIKIIFYIVYENRRFIQNLFSRNF